MKLQDLKANLVYQLSRRGLYSPSVSEEILEEIFPHVNGKDVNEKTITAYEIDGTTILLSHAGLKAPRRVFFIDLLNGNWFVQEVECTEKSPILP